MTGARSMDRAVTSSCLLCRCHRLDGLVAQMFGRDKADQFSRDVLAGKTALIKKMLLAIKGRLEVRT